MVSYNNKKIVIIGLGTTGFSCVEFFMQQGVVPQVMDTRCNPPNSDKLPQEVELYSGGIEQSLLLASDLIVVSPGISLSRPELIQAAAAGIEIIGDIELFCRCADKPIIAITGSNGKSTVTELVGEMINAAGLKAGVGGNIGVPALVLLKQPVDVYVLELSSFQLETTYSLHATAATILNLSEDHMDRYPQGLTQYQRAKQRIYHHANHCIVNADDPLTVSHIEQESPSQKDVVSFGLNNANYHLLYDQYNIAWLAHNSTPFLSTNDMKLVGQHNYLNALAALALVDAISLPREASLQALRTFPGLAHRCQLVWQRNGVSWINDSKATNVGSTIAALTGLTVTGNLYLLLGGDGKNADFSLLLPYLSRDNIKIYCFGLDKEKLALLKPQSTTVTNDLREAVKVIKNFVKPGDVVLLSPACASLDQFKNFEHRGLFFSQLAEEFG